MGVIAVAEKCEMVCARPSSTTTNSPCLRSVIGLPLRSSTRTSSGTSVAPLRNTGVCVCGACAARAVQAAKIATSFIIQLFWTRIATSCRVDPPGPDAVTRAPPLRSRSASSRGPRNRRLHPRAFHTSPLSLRQTIAWFLLGHPSHAYGTTLDMPRSFRRDFGLPPIGPLQSAHRDPSGVARS